MNRRIWLWGVPALCYAVFFCWYTDLGGPLEPDEIAVYLEKFEAIGATPEFRTSIRRFMETDSGRQFLMVNILDMAENPPDVPGAEPGESAEQLMNRYMEHMYPELFKRACHPVTMGNAIYTTMDLVGIEGAEEWDLGALFRYRSRRSLMEIVTIPETLGRHEFKLAALDKTIAFPIETQIYLGDPRLLLALILFSAASLLDLVLYRRNG
jgi:hypothetical protein